jgi:hypothetical protein
MNFLSKLIRGRQPKRPERSDCDPVVIQVIGGRLLCKSDMQTLAYLRLMGRYHHERMEAFAAEACKVVGVEADSETIERDWCDEIVFHGQDEKVTIEQINNYRLDIINNQQANEEDRRIPHAER